MRSLILRKVAQAILPVAVLFSAYLFLRGHNEPGGGFIAGLVITAAIVLEALAFGAAWARERLTPLIRPLFAIGLLMAAISGMAAMLAGDPFLTHYHWKPPLPGGGYIHLTTALLFDLGVFLVVIGTTSTAIAVFAEEAE
ncbi:MAG TPA: MnhB domain-containing protein [Longimicrobiaceae bacterium]|nr:MnhB domain-containing protein [Longimicrobiaceae bacterium]